MHTIGLKLVHVYKIYSSLRESRSHFSEVSHAIDLEAKNNDVTHTNFNCKAVEVTEIEKVNDRKNHRSRRRIKKTTMSPIIAAIASRLLIKSMS